MLTVVLLLTFQTAGTAFAANFFGTNSQIDCGTGNQKLDVAPYTSDGTKYYCVTGLNTNGANAEIEGAGASQKCAAGVAAYSSGFGVLCLTKLQNPTVTTACQDSY